MWFKNIKCIISYIDRWIDRFFIKVSLCKHERRVVRESNNYINTIIQFNSIHAFISDKSPYYTGYINYNHRLLIIN